MRLKKGVMVLITVSFLLFLCIYAKNGTDKTVPNMSVSKENNPTEVYEEMDSDYENDTQVEDSDYENDSYEENPEEMPVKTYPFTKLRPFSEERAWVNFDKDGITYTGIIDTDGKLLYESEGDFFYVSQFLDGTTFYRESSEETSPCGIIDLDGNVLFESQITSDGGYLILGYGKEHFFVISHIQNFDTDEWQYGTLDKNGTILNSMQTDTDNAIANENIYDGDDWRPFPVWINQKECCSIIKYIGENYIALPVGLYNVSTAHFAPFYSSKDNYMYTSAIAIGDFQDGYTVAVIDKTAGGSCSYTINKDYQGPQDIISQYARNDNRSIYSEGLIWTYSSYDYAEKTGYYDKDWNCIISMKKYDDAFGYPFKGGYAGITMTGADGGCYATILNKKGDFMYSPIMVDSGKDAENGYFQVVIDGEKKIIDPEGTIYTPGVDDLSILKGLTFGDVSEGFIIMDSEEDESDATSYYVSLDTNTIIDSVKAASTDMDTVEDESLDGEASDNSYIIPDSYDLTGKWKSIGESDFGQAQPGAIVIFDGSRCNFYSPSDTYAFYYDGDKYVLDVTSPLGESLSWTVNIIDDNNIKIAGARMMRIE